ncbi:MAG: DUF2334 domain-containing protein [Pseudomonadota bacterium]
MTDSLRALLSIHDVMPETFEKVAALRDECMGLGLAPPGLLVVPGRAWSLEQRATLRHWEREGSELIAHGWKHETRPRRLYHRLHAALLSRNVAEHLDLRADAVIALMRRSRDWFAAQGLAPPRTYIPPAWALGIPPRRLAELPFSSVEVLRGVILVQGQDTVMKSLPLTGFEADTALRAATLRLWNRRAEQRSAARGVPLRIAIHPHDGELLLAADLRDLLRRPWRLERYGELRA